MTAGPPTLSPEQPARRSAGSDGTRWPGWLSIALLLVAYFGVDAALPVVLDRWIQHWSVFSEDPDSHYFLIYAWVFLLCGQWGTLAIWLVFGTSRWPARLIASLVAAALLTATVFASNMAVQGQWELSKLRETLCTPLFTLTATAPLWPLWLWRGWRLTNPDSPARGGKPGIRNLLWATTVVAATIAVAGQGVANVVPEARAAAVVQYILLGIGAGVLLVLPAFCAMFVFKRPMLGFVIIMLYSFALALAFAAAGKYNAGPDEDRSFAMYLAMSVAFCIGPMLPLAGSLLVLRWTGWTLCRRPSEIAD